MEISFLSNFNDKQRIPNASLLKVRLHVHRFLQSILRSTDPPQTPKSINYKEIVGKEEDFIDKERQDYASDHEFDSSTEEEPEDSECEFQFHSSASTKEQIMILYAKYGWLLMSKGILSMFFFNPMTKQRINLPDFSNDNCLGRTCFSTAPTSSDCIVVVILSWVNLIKVIFIRHGEDSWSSSYFPRDPDIPSRSNPVFYNGQFYLMGKSGNIRIYNPEKGEDEPDAWRVLDNPKRPCSSINDSYLIESNGKLLAVFTGFMGQWVRVYKLVDDDDDDDDDDYSTMAWKEVNNLDDTTLFVTESASFSATELKVQGLENSVFFPHYNEKNGAGIFYSLSSRKFYSLWSDFAKQDFYDTKKFVNCAWIKPNYEMYTEKELNWLHSEEQVLQD